VEYQREGYDMFSAMMEGIKEESVGNLFNLQVQRQDSPIVEEAAGGGPVLSVVPDGAGPGGAAPAGAIPAGAGVVPAAPGGQDDHGQPAPPIRPGRHSRSTASAGRPGARQRGGGQAQPGAQPAPGQEGPEVPAALAARGLDRPQRPSRLQYSAPSEDGSGNAQQRAASAGGVDYSKVGRNAPCPCGSGRKFKQCHGDPRNR
jgi:preprotein translocase subunit SecA